MCLDNSTNVSWSSFMAAKDENDKKNYVFAIGHLGRDCLQPFLQWRSGSSLGTSPWSGWCCPYSKKMREIFLACKEIQSHMYEDGLYNNEEMRKYFVIYIRIRKPLVVFDFAPKLLPSFPIFLSARRCFIASFRGLSFFFFLFPLLFFYLWTFCRSLRFHCVEGRWEQTQHCCVIGLRIRYKV